jgi:hypothetical protein
LPYFRRSGDRLLLNADEEALLKLSHRWRREAGQAGRQIKRIVVAYEAGRHDICLARWLRARDVATMRWGNAHPFGEPADICRCVTVSSRHHDAPSE